MHTYIHTVHDLSNWQDSTAVFETTSQLGWCGLLKTKHVNVWTSRDLLSFTFHLQLNRHTNGQLVRISWPWPWQVTVSSAKLKLFYQTHISTPCKTEAIQCLLTINLRGRKRKRECIYRHLIRLRRTWKLVKTGTVHSSMRARISRPMCICINKSVSRASGFRLQDSGFKLQGWTYRWW